jgi:hypothetical protein
MTCPPKFPKVNAGRGKRSVSLVAGGLVVGGTAWYAELMSPVWAAEALGPICAHAGALALHCPACYAALAMVGAGLGLATLGLSARVLRRAKVHARR